MARPMWTYTALKILFPRRPADAKKLAKFPRIQRMFDDWLAGGDNLVCLPNDKVIAINESIDAPENFLLPSQVVEHFINEASYIWKMNNCICRDALQCKDYPINIGCLHLGVATKDIHPGLGRHVSKQEALDHVKRARAAGLIQMVGKSKLDTVWLKVGPGDKLFTICSCCPCCCVSRSKPYSSDRVKANFHRLPGVSVKVKENCTGCGKCTKGICFMSAINLEEDRAVINEECLGCGRCAEICPSNAIDFTVANKNYVKEAIEHLSQSVDVK